MTLTDLLTRIESKTHLKPRKSGAGYVCRCPAHEDKAPSLTVGQGENGKLLVNCKAGCGFKDIADALGLKSAEFFADKPGRNGGHGHGKPSAAPARAAATAPQASNAPSGPRSEPAAVYPYRDESGAVLFEVCRFEPGYDGEKKTFRQRRPDKASLGGYTWKTSGVRQVPYRLPELLAAVKDGQPIYIAEGEKDVAALVKAGFAATCNAGGAGKWKAEFSPHLKGTKAVAVIADKDEPGRKHAAAVAAALAPAVPSVRVLELPDVAGQSVKDAADFFAAGGTAEQLRELVAKAPEFKAAAAVAAASAGADARLPVMNPNAWFKARFPKLAEKHGEPVALKVPMNGRPSVQDLNESFMAGVMGLDACPDAPTVFLRTEGRFYTYRPELGIFATASEEDLSARLSGLLLDCARDCRETCDVGALEFQLRDTSALTGAVKRARAMLAVPNDFFASVRMEEFLPVRNGVLRLADRTLLPFSPDYRFRNRLAVDYVPGARCPMFEDTLLRPSLEPEDIGLLQRAFGLFLVGRNIAQRIFILSGTAGAGKGTVVRVLKGIIGEANIGSLRTDQLGQRFEIGLLVNKTLLYGGDVPADFLNRKSASALKNLTGGDHNAAEMKSSMDTATVKGEFNMLVTSNNRLAVHLEGDVDAWLRRLAIIAYTRPKPANVIPDLECIILTTEGPGVLNWALDGLYALRAANWQLALSPGQQERVNELLLESDSVNVFFRERGMADTRATGITVTEAFVAYCEFCMDRGWNPLDRNAFGKDAPETVQRTFRLATRHDIKGADNKPQRGWKGLRLREAGETDPEETM